MSLMKWIRKNNRKIMVFVIIFSMIAFVIGSYGLKIIANMFDPNNRVIATYDDGEAIKSVDIGIAQNELAVLRMLSGDRLLAAQGTGGALLSHLIFPDSPFTSDLAAQLKQAVLQGQVPIGLDELEAYFSQKPENAAIVWILLKAEARRAGYLISSDNAKNLLKQLIPQMTQGQGTAAQLVEAVIQKSGQTEPQIVRTFADLLTVSDYANRVMNNQAVTLNQVKSAVGRNAERLDAEFAELEAETFVDETAEVSEAAIQAQFDAYKTVTPGTPTEDNPYGFGYKLPRRIQLEYLVIETDNAKKRVDAPTADEMERYYRTNIAQFQTSEPSDPNDPDSEKVVLTKSYAEVERQIRTTLEREKTSHLTNAMINDIKNITEAGFENITFEEVGNEALQMAAGDYEAAVKQVAAAHQVAVTTGKTGWLSPADFQQEKILRSLSRQRGQQRLPLSELAFTASPQPDAPRRIGLPAVRVWENIGPVTGGYWDPEASQYHALTALVRVVDVQEATVPEDVNVQYSTRGVALFENEDETDARHSVKDDVIADLRLLRAMDTATARARELAALAQNSDWTQAVKTYNDRYAPGADDPNAVADDAQAVALDLIEDQMRAPQSEINLARQYIADNPGAAPRIRPMLVANALNNELYALLDNGEPTTGTIAEVLPFEPGRACYVVKEVLRKPATTADYREAKAQTAAQLASQDMPSLALVHFSTDNILARMNFAYTEPDEDPSDAEAVTE